MIWLILFILQSILVILFISSTRNLVYSDKRFNREPIKSERFFYILSSVLIFVPFLGIIYWGFVIYEMIQIFLKHDSYDRGRIDVAEGKHNWLHSLVRYMKGKI